MSGDEEAVSGIAAHFIELKAVPGPCLQARRSLK